MGSWAESPPAAQWDARPEAEPTASARSRAGVHTYEACGEYSEEYTCRQSTVCACLYFLL